MSTDPQPAQPDAPPPPDDGLPKAAPSEQEACADATPPPEPDALTEADLSAIEAILFTTDNPLSPAKVAEVAGLAGGRKAVRLGIEQLNARYEQMGCSFRIESLAGGYQMLTLPGFNEVLARLLKVRSESRLSQSALEALAIVAYKQPVLRADVEAIRGVSSGEMIRSLMEKGLVKIVGRAEEIGRPMLYGTTVRFLEVFGLSDLKDLPKVEELALYTKATPPADAQADEPAPTDADQPASPARGDEAREEASANDENS